MRIASHELRLEKRSTLIGWQAAIVSILAIVVALALFSLIFILGHVNPLTAYKEIFSYAFANRFGVPLTINRFIFLLLCTYAFIIPYRAGLWNIGMTGQLFAGALSAFSVVYAFGGSRSTSAAPSPGLVIPLMLAAAAAGGAILGALPGFLKGRFNVNEIVVTMMLNFIAYWVVSEMIKERGAFTMPGGEGAGFELPASLRAPLMGSIPYTLFLALGAGVLLYYLFARTRLGYEIRAFGLSPAAARYAGIGTLRIPFWVFVLGGALAGLAAYHYFTAVPGLYRIPKDYSHYGDLAFYGIICGLISIGNPFTAIPVALLFGGLTVGGRYVQGKLHIGFGIDLALLGVLMITLVAFQFLYRYSVVWAKSEGETLDVGVRG